MILTFEHDLDTWHLTALRWTSTRQTSVKDYFVQKLFPGHRQTHTCDWLLYLHHWSGR